MARFEEAEFRLYRETFDLESLCCAMPRMMGMVQAAQEIKQQIATDDSSRGQFTRGSGFAEGGALRRVGWLPIEVFIAVEEISPGFFKDQRKRDRFLRENPIFSMVERVD